MGELGDHPNAGRRHQIFHFPAVLENGRKKTVTIEVIRRKERWAVCGYLVGADLILGVRTDGD